MKTNNLPDKETLQIWIDGLADVLQYLTLTDNQGHDKECAQSCFTVAGVRELLQGLAEEIDAKKDELSLSLSDRKEAFLKELEQYREEYEADMLNDFFEYWTEPNKSQTKMRFEAQKFFKTKSRLNAWKNRKFNK